MSTRLLTMKFMQRAAASSNSTPETTPDRRDAKRQRMSNGSYNSSPVESSDARAVRKALAVEEQKRQQAVDREAARRGETKWYLDVQPASKPEKQHFTVVSTGYASLDSDHAITRQVDEDESDSDVDTAFQGRRSFGIRESKANDEHEDDRAADNSDDEQSTASYRTGENDTPTSKKRKVDKDANLEDDRGGKKVNLHRVKSMSSINSQSARSSNRDQGKKNRKHHSKNHGKKKA